MKKITHQTCITVILIVIFLLSIASCATVGRPFPVENVAKIQTGTTTRDDITRFFGRPWRIGIEDGDTTWTYGNYRYKLFGNTETTDLVIRFRDNGIVDSYSFNTTDTDANTANY